MPEFEFPPGMPEELKEFVIKKATRAEMEMDATRHDLARFFDELSSDQLRTLCGIFGSMDRKTAMYYQGYATALLQVKFNLCAGCGQDHDKFPFQDEVQVVKGDGEGDPLPEFNPDIPGIVDGKRVDTCSTCHGDLVIKVCEHPVGTHGQRGREECPEPTLVPCCECRCPEWYTREDLNSTHGNCGGTFLPLSIPNTFICSNCGEHIIMSNWQSGTSENN